MKLRITTDTTERNPDYTVSLTGELTDHAISEEIIVCVHRLSGNQDKDELGNFGFTYSQLETIGELIAGIAEANDVVENWDCNTTSQFFRTWFSGYSYGQENPRDV